MIWIEICIFCCWFRFGFEFNFYFCYCLLLDGWCYFDFDVYGGSFFRILGNGVVVLIFKNLEYREKKIIELLIFKNMDNFVYS